MRFSLLDRVEDVVPGVRLSAIKNLSLAEEYLADHFPGFPVMPGVLMIEAMVQAGAWLVRCSEDFARSIVVLQEARNVRFQSFVEPGETLRIQVEWGESDGSVVRLKASGAVGERATVSARLALHCSNLADARPEQAAADEVVRREMRRLWSVLRPVRTAV